jgi:hypothetical protein
MLVLSRTRSSLRNCWLEIADRVGAVTQRRACIVAHTMSVTIVRWSYSPLPTIRRDEAGAHARFVRENHEPADVVVDNTYNHAPPVGVKHTRRMQQSCASMDTYTGRRHITRLRTCWSAKLGTAHGPAVYETRSSGAAGNRDDSGLRRDEANLVCICSTRTAVRAGGLGTRAVREGSVIETSDVKNAGRHGFSAVRCVRTTDDDSLANALESVTKRSPVSVRNVKPNGPLKRAAVPTALTCVAEEDAPAAARTRRRHGEGADDSHSMSEQEVRARRSALAHSPTAHRRRAHVRRAKRRRARKTAQCFPSSHASTAHANVATRACESADNVRREIECTNAAVRAVCDEQSASGTDA